MFTQILAPFFQPDHVLVLALGLLLETLILLVTLMPQCLRLDALEALGIGGRLASLTKKQQAIEVAAANRLAEIAARVQALEALEAKLVPRLQRMEELSYFDPLTGLRAGSLFRAELAALAQRFQPVVVLYLDLDNFRLANSQGHEFGDVQLQLAAAALRAAFPRGSDRIYRLYKGGDEFAVIADATQADGMRLGRRALQELAARKLSATIGCASSEHHDWRELEAAADLACQLQKQVAKGQCREAAAVPLEWSARKGRRAAATGAEVAS